MKMMNRCFVIAFGLVFSVGAVYMLLFRKPPADIIMATNNKQNTTVSAKTLLEIDTSKLNALQFAKAKWDAWIVVNEHVAIGEVYDSCDEKTRQMVGRIIMTNDAKLGGLISRTVTNVTYDHSITGGDMGIKVWYNGQLLHKSHWDLCDSEDDVAESERVMPCPIKAGRHKYVKDLLIPGYLPKGRYQTKCWTYDQNDKNIGCAFSDFTL